MPQRRKLLSEQRQTSGVDEKVSRLIKAADSDADSFEGETGADDALMFADNFEQWAQEKPNTSNQHRRKSATAHKELRKLRLGNPTGSSTSVSSPDYSVESNTVRRSQRRVELERQRRSRASGEGDLKTSHELSASSGVHDRQGRVITQDGRRVQLCDCLDVACVGCHLPCPKCASTFCGGECQRGRRYFYAEIQINGQPRHTIRHPFYDES